MKDPARSVADGFLDLVYPPKCLTCQKLGPAYLCDSCRAGMERVPRPYCLICGHPIFRDRCRLCWGRIRSFTAARAAGDYGGVLRQAIHEFKYNSNRVLADPLAEFLHTYLSESSDIPWERADLIVAVPMHPARKRLRGYNQSELLGDALAELTGLPCEHDALRRSMRTRPQIQLPGELRRVNVRGAFRPTRPDLLKHRTVLLVDDVATTCSTVHECSLALLRGGAERVYVACLAFGA